MQKLLFHLKSASKYLIALLLLVIPLYPKFPFIRVPGTYVAIRFEDFLIAVSVLLLVIFYFPDLVKLVKEKLPRAMIYYLIIGFISLLSGILITQTVTLNIGVLHFLRRIEYFTPYFIGFVVFRKDSCKLDYYIKLLLLTIIVSFIYGYGQKHFNWPIIITQNQEYAKGVALRWIPGSHINAFFAGHYDLATYLVMVMPIVISLLVLLKNYWQKVFLTVVSFMGLWLLVNSASRISIASYLIATSISLLVIKKIRFIPVVILISFIFVGFSSNLLSRYSRIFDVIKENIISPQKTSFVLVEHIYAQGELESLPVKRIVATPTPTPIPVFEDRSTSIRLNVEWPRAIRAVTKNPLLGTGYSSITLATDNDFLRALGETGLLGFTAFMLMYLVIVWEIKKTYKLFSRKNNPVELAFFAGIIGALVGVFINALFIDIFEASKFAIIYWLFIGILLSLLKDEPNIKENHT